MIGVYKNVVLCASFAEANARKTLLKIIASFLNLHTDFFYLPFPLFKTLTRSNYWASTRRSLLTLYISLYIESKSHKGNFSNLSYGLHTFLEP